MITHLPAANRVAVPWKNGGGVTCEVAVSPPCAGMDDFDWRISMAEVTEPGPFSCFPGVARHLTVLRGRLRLDFEDRSHELGPFDSLAFDGDVPVFGTPLEPVLDLNVMTRNGISASVHRLEREATISTAIALLIDPLSLDAKRIDDGNGARIWVPSPRLLVEFR